MKSEVGKTLNAIDAEWGGCPYCYGTGYVTTHHRYFGHGGEIVMINLQAARRYAVELLEGAA